MHKTNFTEIRNGINWDKVVREIDFLTNLISFFVLFFFDFFVEKSQNTIMFKANNIQLYYTKYQQLLLSLLIIITHKNLSELKCICILLS